MILKCYIYHDERESEVKRTNKEKFILIVLIGVIVFACVLGKNEKSD